MDTSTCPVRFESVDLAFKAECACQDKGVDGVVQGVEDLLLMVGNILVAAPDTKLNSYAGKDRESFPLLATDIRHSTESHHQQSSSIPCRVHGPRPTILTASPVDLCFVNAVSCQCLVTPTTKCYVNNCRLTRSPSPLHRHTDVSLITITLSKAAIPASSTTQTWQTHLKCGCASPTS